MADIDFSLIPIGWLILLGIQAIAMVCLVVCMFFFVFPSLSPKWMTPKGVEGKPVEEYNTNYGGGYSSSETKKEDTSSWDNNNINLMQNF